MNAWRNQSILCYSPEYCSHIATTVQPIIVVELGMNCCLLGQLVHTVSWENQQKKIQTQTRRKEETSQRWNSNWHIRYLKKWVNPWTSNYRRMRNALSKLLISLNWWTHHFALSISTSLCSKLRLLGKLSLYRSERSKEHWCIFLLLVHWYETPQVFFFRYEMLTVCRHQAVLWALFTI